jgi:hypothetical protein
VYLLVSQMHICLMWSQRVNLRSREGASLPSGEFLAGYTTGSFRVPEPVRFCIGCVVTRGTPRDCPHLRYHWCGCSGSGSDNDGCGGRGGRSALAEGAVGLTLRGGVRSDGLLSDRPVAGLAVDPTGSLD